MKRILFSKKRMTKKHMKFQFAITKKFMMASKMEKYCWEFIPPCDNRFLHLFLLSALRLVRFNDNVCRRLYLSFCVCENLVVVVVVIRCGIFNSFVRKSQSSHAFSSLSIKIYEQENFLGPICQRTINCLIRFQIIYCLEYDASIWVASLVADKWWGIFGHFKMFIFQMNLVKFFISIIISK